MTDNTYNAPAPGFEAAPQIEVNAERQPVVTAKGGEAFANSRDVADFFAKRHDAVLRDIRDLLEKEPDLRLHSFVETVVTRANPSGGAPIQSPAYDMTRDGFTLLAMGFNGAKALKWKLSYLAAFNVMEAQLRRPQTLPDFSDPKVLLGAFQHLQAQVAEKDNVIAEQGVKLKKLDRLEGAQGSMCISDAAKTLGVGRDFLFKFMFARRWIFKRAGNKNWLAYDDKRKALLLEHDDHLYMDNLGQERVATRVLVTAKGLVKLAELLEEPLH